MCKNKGIISQNVISEFREKHILPRQPMAAAVICCFSEGIMTQSTVLVIKGQIGSPTYLKVVRTKPRTNVLRMFPLGYPEI